MSARTQAIAIYRSMLRSSARVIEKAVSSRRMVVPVLLALLVLPACRTTAPGAADPSARSRSAEPTNVLSTAEGTADSERPDYTEADVHFMQHMIVHHAQAVRMSSLVPERSSNEPLAVLAKRIGISQRDEIALMQSWLRRRGEPVPQPDCTYPLEDGYDLPAMEGMHGGHAGTHGRPPMAGLLTMEQMAALAAASGSTFDRLFLRGMIHHHQGALTMVDHLFATPGAAQDPLTFELANGISGTQRSEMRRMHAMLTEITPDSTNQ